MKTLLICFLIFVFSENNACKKYEVVKIREIEIINKQLDSLIYRSIQSIEREFKLDKTSIITLSIEQKDSINHIQFSLIPKSSINYRYRETNLNIIGYCTVNENEIYILNNYYTQLMSWKNNTKNFIFTKMKKSKNEKIPPPPSISNSVKFDFIQKKDGTIIQISDRMLQK